MPGMVGSVMTSGGDGLLLFAGVALFVGAVDFFVEVAGLLVVFLRDFGWADHAPDNTASRPQRTKLFAIKR
jgi:hypothetical protein